MVIVAFQPCLLLAIKLSIRSSGTENSTLAWHFTPILVTERVFVDGERLPWTRKRSRRMGKLLKLYPGALMVAETFTCITREVNRNVKQFEKSMAESVKVSEKLGRPATNVAAPSSRSSPACHSSSRQ
jgi:hypothetical protein